MNIKHIKYLFAAIALTACTADDADWQLSAEQQQLIGQGVNFSATMADQFVTRTTYNPDGSFNEGDQMRIFRQYANPDGTTFDEANEIFRTYYYKMNYATGTNFSINNDWMPGYQELGKQKYNVGTGFSTQTSGDSLTWENGKIVRFRAWGQSNLSGCLDNGTRDNYYPDYTVSDWVTVSGPTQDIPLTMRHIACRIALVPKNGNEFSRVELCTQLADYKRKDNADKTENDNIETDKTDVQAQQELDEVMAAYNKMCMPAGVNDKTFQLTAMTQALYNDESTNFKQLEQYTEGIVTMGSMGAGDIATQVQHPVFKNNNGNQYFVAIPYDMSNSKETGGSELVLPACTRFRVYLRNDGDYHIFALSDILKSGSTEQAFPQGITLKAGYSYSFSVGYQYDHLTITPADNFSWVQQDLGAAKASDDTKGEVQLDFTWWVNAFQKAITNSKTENSFNPVFTITTPEQFITFIHLCNGTATSHLPKATRGELRKDGDNTIKIDDIDSYWWTIEGDVDANGKPVKYTRLEMQEKGYLFYPLFHKSVGTNPAYAEEICVSGPYNFYNEVTGNRFVVNLGDDIDLADRLLPSIATDIKFPFRGQFRGNGKTLSNLYMQSGYLFDYVMDGCISNLKIESIHNTCLLHSGTYSSSTDGWGCYIAGISMLCPSQTNSIAETLNGASSVVGCIHVGNAGGALVGSASNLNMTGCMQAAAGITAKTGALLGSGSVAKTTFMYNFYDVELSPDTYAVGTVQDAYDYDKYIRGSKSHILKAVHDYMIGDDVDISKLTDNLKAEMYGLAPWKAMNQGIDAYNNSTIGEKCRCDMLYSNTDGYSHRYPTLNKKKTTE